MSTRGTVTTAIKETRKRVRSPEDMPRPFLKWAGGKRQLVGELSHRLPADFGAYHEPFVGGGALFFALHRSGRLGGKRVHLSDINQELMACYRAIRDDVESMIRALGTHRYQREHYYHVRSQDPWSLTPQELAARMIFLNRAGFNGLYRVNSKGKFNVPFGRYKNPRLCDPENLRAVASALKGVDLHRETFERVLERAEPGDLVYFDPPYVPLSSTAHFVSYVSDGFGQSAQQRLAEVFAELAGRGVRVMLSNSDTEAVHELYRDFRRDPVQARRSVNSRSDRRGPTGELIVLGYEL